MRLDGQVIVVTGAGRGNGRAIAERLAAEGAHVVLGDINVEEVSAVAKAIESGGGRAVAQRCDVSDESDVEALMAAAETLGGPHALVAQAGATFDATLEDTTPQQWDWFLSVDLRGTYLCARAAIPRMRRLGGGSIVNMSGTYAYMPEYGVAVQAAAKGAILALTRALAVEVGRDNIRVNCIVPGYIETPMVANWAASHDDPQAALAAAARLHSLRRLGKPEEVAATAAFLCSADSSFSTGHPYHVDGGLAAGMNATKDSSGAGS